MSTTLARRAAAVAAGAALALTGALAVPAAHAATTPVLSIDNMPATYDLAFNEFGDWRWVSTSATHGKVPGTDCLLGHKLETLGATTSYRRDWRLRDAPAANRVTAYGFEFASAGKARTALTTLKGWLNACPRTLRDAGYAESSRVDFYPVPVASLPISTQTAEFGLLSYSLMDDPDADERNFGELGLVRTGNRVALVALTTQGQDYNFSLDGQDVAMYPSLRSLPKVAARIAKDATARRHLSDAQLIRTTSVPTYADERVLVTSPGNGRPVEDISVCQLSGLSGLKAKQSRSRNFRYAAEGVRSTKPSIYTLALQFSDNAAAERAYDRYTAWVEACPKHLREAGFTVPRRTIDWAGAPTTVGKGKFTEIIYKRPGKGGNDAGWFESIGLTRVGDRLMITVSLVYGMDYNVSWQPNGDETGLPPHPQFTLVKAAAKRLAA